MDCMLVLRISTQKDTDSTPKPTPTPLHQITATGYPSGMTRERYEILGKLTERDFKSNPHYALLHTGYAGFLVGFAVGARGGGVPIVPFSRLA
jgi:hypothetical protein